MEARIKYGLKNNPKLIYSFTLKFKSGYYINKNIFNIHMKYQCVVQAVIPLTVDTTYFLWNNMWTIDTPTYAYNSPKS